MRKSVVVSIHLTLILVLAASVLSAQSASTWVFFGSDGLLHYKTDSQGNRIMDFSFAGYKGGGVALPVIPVAASASPVSGDNTSNIQAAIDSVSQLSPDANGFRGAVLLAAGRYDVSGTLNVTAGGVVLRGSGSGANGTILNMTGSAHLLLSIKGSGTWQTVGPSAVMTDSFIPSGVMSFHVDNASSFSVGDSVLILRPVTQNWVHFMNMDTLVRNGQPQTWIKIGTSIRTDRVIAGISGNQITLDAPLTDSFDGTLLNPPAGSMVKYTFPGRISQVGVEHLGVIAPAQDLDISNPQFQAMTMDTVINGWVRDVAIQDTDNSVTIGGATKQITLEGVSVSHSLAFTPTAGPADFSISGTRNLVSRCSSRNNTGVWPIVTQAEVTGPNAVLNFSADQRGVAPHQRWATGLLTDSSQLTGATPSTQGIAYSNRGNFGSGQGWDVGWAVAWNVTSPDFLVQGPPGAHNWCIGCVGTVVTKSDPNGDYDSLGTHVTPNSLYLEQLKERLGNLAVANIGYGDFALSATPGSNSVAVGSTGSYSISVAPSGIFTDSVALSVSGAPAGATVSFSPKSLASGSASMSIATSASTPPGTYTLAIAGASGNLTHTTSVILTVNAAVGSTSFEAEAAGNTLSGTAKAATCSACSGGKKVGFIGNGSNNFVTINNINVAKSGPYKVAIFYLVNGTRSLSVSVNGGSATTLSLSGSSFSVPAAVPAAVTVQLKAGSNSIQFGNTTAFAPDLDRITVTAQ